MQKAADPTWNMQMAMAAGAFLCIVVGSVPGLLYSLLPYPVNYHTYGGYHMAETLQILGFGALAFFMLKQYLVPEDKICLDLDWLYRKAGTGFVWIAKNPIQWFDTAWGEAYRVVGVGPLMVISRFWSWFDWHGIDGVVDGIARCVRAVGGRVRTLQSGQIQYTLYFSATFAALILIAYVLFQLS